MTLIREKEEEEEGESTAHDRGYQISKHERLGWVETSISFLTPFLTPSAPSPRPVPTGSLSCGGDVMICVKHINKQTELAHSLLSLWPFQLYFIP